jgi:ketosteroid isomerase-like protein
MSDLAGRPTARILSPAPVPAGEAPATPATGDRVPAGGAGEALVRRYFEELQSGGNPAQTADLFAADYVGHDPNLPLLPPGPGGVALHVVASRTAFPDQRVTVDDLFGAGDRVAVRFTLRGTHLGELLDIAPTGQRVEAHGAAIYRIAGGRIAEGWVGFDALGLLDQLGLLAPLGPSAAGVRPPLVGGAPPASG